MTISAAMISAAQHKYDELSRRLGWLDTSRPDADAMREILTSAIAADESPALIVREVGGLEGRAFLGVVLAGDVAAVRAAGKFFGETVRLVGTSAAEATR